MQLRVVLWATVVLGAAAAAASCHANRTVGDLRFCSPLCRCEEGEGDCDSDDHCAGDLVCSYDVGSDYGFDEGVDVCIRPEDLGEGRNDSYCMQVGSDNDINYYLTNNNSVDVCWRVSCDGWVRPERFALRESGAVFYLGGTPYTNYFPDRALVHAGDEARLVSHGSLPQTVGFNLYISCEEEPCTAVGDGDEIDYYYDYKYPYLTNVCWNVACNSTGVLQFSAFDLADNDYLYLGTNRSTGFTGHSLIPPFPFRGSLEVLFTSDISVARRGFRANVTCFEGCENPFFSRTAGYLDACSVECPCEEGEGDCDSDDECKLGLKCSHNVGLKYGVAANIDVCEDPSSGMCSKVDLVQHFSVLEHLEYENNEDVCWEAECPKGGWVTFDVFSTEEGYDWLEIGGKNYSGDSLPPRRGFTTLYMRFKSDKGVKGKGFRATFVCQS